MEHDEHFADEHEFCCNRPKGCPKAAKDGDSAVISAPVDEISTDASGRVSIKFEADQARELFKWLKDKGFDS